MKKFLVSLAACAVTASAMAGFDTYTGKHFTQLLAPSAMAAGAAVASSATDGTKIAGLPGNGAIVISAGAGTGVVSVVLSQCATTNGTYTTVTNNGVSSWAFTNSASVRVFSFKPNDFSPYIRTTATPSTGTTGSVSVLLITE